MLKTLRDYSRPRSLWRAVPVVAIGITCLLPWSLVQASSKQAAAPPSPRKAQATASTKRKVQPAGPKKKKKPAATIVSSDGRILYKIYDVEKHNAQERRTKKPSASPRVYKIYRQDSKDPKRKFEEMNVVVLQYAPASDVMQKLKQEFANEGVNITADERMNAIIVKGSSEPFEKALKHIQEIDRAAKGSPQVYKVYPIKNKSAGALATILRREFPITKEQRGFIYFDDKANSIIVQTEPAIQSRIRMRIADLDK